MTATTGTERAPLPDRPTPLAPATAVRIILSHVAPLPPERIALGDALDRTLAADVESPLDIPPWDNSAMDGYAVRSADVGTPTRDRDASWTPVELQVIETIRAGSFPTKRLGTGECARIFTGAPVPEGADGVIRQEHTTTLEGDRVRINDQRDVGKNIRRLGEDIRSGAVVVARGTTIGPAQIGVLAAVAAREVEVHRRPTVALLASGDEIADLDERDAIVSGRKIASSNTYTMLAMIRRAGGEAVNLGIARDDPADIRDRLLRAADADLVVTSAGMSVGEHDYFRTVLRELDTTLEFWRLRMRPGAPVGFGLLRGTPWIGLPGNPVSTMVTFELFVRPAIRKFAGHATLFRRAISVRVGERITLGPRLCHFLRVRLAVEHDTLTAYLTGPQSSGILSSMAKADALLIVPADMPHVAAGQTLQALRLDEPVHVEEAPF